MNKETFEALKKVLNHSKAYGGNKKWSKIVEAWIDEVAGQKGEECADCGTPMIKTPNSDKLSGGMSWSCPNCYK